METVIVQIRDVSNNETGLWELIGTPMEMGAGRESTSRFIVTYGPDNKIKDVKAVGGAKKLKEM